MENEIKILYVRTVGTTNHRPSLHVYLVMFIFFIFFTLHRLFSPALAAREYSNINSSSTYPNSPLHSTGGVFDSYIRPALTFLFCAETGISRYLPSLFVACFSKSISFFCLFFVSWQNQAPLCTHSYLCPYFVFFTLVEASYIYHLLWNISSLFFQRMLLPHIE